MNPLSRVLTWGCSIATIQFITFILLTIYYGYDLASTVLTILLLPATVLGAWGGAMVRQRGWIINKRIL